MVLLLVRASPLELFVQGLVCLQGESCRLVSRVISGYARIQASSATAGSDMRTEGDRATKGKEKRMIGNGID